MSIIPDNNLTAASDVVDLEELNDCVVLTTLDWSEAELSSLPISLAYACWAKFCPYEVAGIEVWE